MRTDVIEAVGIDEGGSLWVKPATTNFPYIYRVDLRLGPDTTWTGVDPELRKTFANGDLELPL